MEKNGLGKRINAVRKDRGLTADRLSEMCNINATYLRQIEGGVKMPSLPVFIDICKALKISPDYLLQDELEENEISTIREIEALWKDTSPSKQALALAMIKADGFKLSKKLAVNVVPNKNHIFFHSLNTNRPAFCVTQAYYTISMPRRADNNI